jgi:hypothetical protein
MKRVPALHARPGFLLPAILALGLVVRLFGLTYHSLWLAETASVAWARLPAGEKLAHTITLREDPYPP